ncbi:hypothetical protein IFM89_036356 [Coptis chinensis]|uniref:Aminotransferase-like plant mobile domain-containing protein n=1 Tax=Coptis chinensis TaxID=261450 RepID=A0A835LLE1_9MAGN|nr:hypothetical protein IFM89_036356 [Coptis chinensis]
MIEFASDGVKISDIKAAYITPLTNDDGLQFLINYLSLDFDDGQAHADEYVRAFYMYLMSALFLPSGHSTINLGYLANFEHLHELGGIDFGGAIYCNLLRCLDRASRQTGVVTSPQLGGFVILLEVWFYEYFRATNPILTEYIDERPRPKAWHRPRRAHLTIFVMSSAIRNLIVGSSKVKDQFGKLLNRFSNFLLVKNVGGREFNYSERRFSFSDCRHVVSRYLPVYGPWEIDRFNTRAYVSQFSDGSLLVAGFTGSHIKIYNVEKDWKVQKDILAKSLRWTVTDTSLSPDQRYLVYASMSPFVHIVDIGSATKESHANVTEIHDGLDFSADGDGEYSFGIFSVKFSTDGRELVAGSSDDSIYVYDLVSNKLTLRIAAHSCALLMKLAISFYSGSDDNLCKVWDRRCIGKGKPAGVLMGHLEGITFIDSRGDGRYFISNGKDQTIKLWDIRKMPSNASSSSSSGMQFRNYEWDYRWMEYPPRARNMKHPCDQSLSTYRGHSFSADGSLLVAGSQGSHTKIYNVEKDWKVQKDILAKSLRWTVTDTSLSPDQRYLTMVSSTYIMIDTRRIDPSVLTCIVVTERNVAVVLCMHQGLAELHLLLQV